MSKTPYEIRLDLLAMAQGILSEQNINKRIQLENDWNMDCERVRINADRTQTAPTFQKFPDVPNYTDDAVISMAKKLNDFVSNG